MGVNLNRLARQIQFKGAVLTIEVECLRSADGQPIVSKCWSPCAPLRLTIDEAEALHAAVIRTQRELLDEVGST